MTEHRPIVITGVAGNLGARLLPLLGDFPLIGVDMHPPQTTLPLRFEALDLGREETCEQLLTLLREVRPAAVVHLAFVLDPVRADVLDAERMWQINVAGTARVMEAITEANRNEDDGVRQFIHLSSVSAYGCDLSRPATEETRLAGHTLPYAIHKREADEVVQMRAPALRNCSVYILRPHIFAGASMENYMVGAFRGTPNGTGARAARMREAGKRLPCMLPWGERYLRNRLQFVHVDDVARLIAHLLRHTEPATQRLTVLNVAGRGEPLDFARCIELAENKLVRVPGMWAARMVLEFLWKRRISAIPPEALPYMTSEYVMDTTRLRNFLGAKYEDTIKYTVEEAFRDTFRAPSA
jgi:nucleoside-diphosphate-sugar epimerase